MRNYWLTRITTSRSRSAVSRWMVISSHSHRPWPIFIQMLSQVDHHLDKLSARENRWIEFVRSVDIMTGGVLVRHGCFEEGYWMGEILSMYSKYISMKVPNIVGNFLRN